MSAVNSSAVQVPRAYCVRVVREILPRHPGVALREVFSPSLYPPVVAVRYAAMRLVHQRKPEASIASIGRGFGRHHTSVLYALGRRGRRGGVA